ncbi:unnamed protein product [Arabidopsis halleri]
MMSWNRVEEDEEYKRAVHHYWRQVALTDGFDVEGIKQPPHPLNYGGMICITVPEEGWWGFPFRREVTLYARFGLHRFNMKEGTKWELDNIIKFNVRTRNLASTFFITLAAHDSDRRRQILQVRVDEIKNGSGRLDLVCSIAKVKGDRGEPTNVPTEHPLDFPCCSPMPSWPLDDDDYLQGLYLVEGSELLDTHWIRLYLELAIDRAENNDDPDFSNLVIVKAVIDTAEKEAPLNAKNSILYIVFKGVVVRGVGADVERKAVIKTDFNEQTGFLSIKGVVCRGPQDKRPRTFEEVIRSFRHPKRVAV